MPSKKVSRGASKVPEIQKLVKDYRAGKVTPEKRYKEVVKDSDRKVDLSTKK